MRKLIEPAEGHQTDINRKTWADLCRVAAIFGVVVIHACGANFYLFSKIPDSDWLSINLLDSLIRCSVPLFVMLSGALLLSPQATPATPLQILGRIRKVAIPLLPVLQAVFATIAKRPDLQHYLLALWMLVTCVPIYYPLPILDLLQQTSLLGYAGYFLMGGIVAEAHQQSSKTLPWVLVYLAAVFITAWLTWRFSIATQSADERAYLYFSPNVVFASLASFILFTRMRFSSRHLIIALQWISDRSFLVFFIHVVVLERVQNQVTTLELPIPVVIQTILVSALTFLLCLGIASLFRLLPKSRAFLG